MVNSLTELIDKVPELENINSLDDFLKLTQYVGSIDRAVTNNLYGLNTYSRGVIPIAKESYGRVFFTRPQLAMVSSNLRNDRHFYSLLTKDKNTVHDYVRKILDPRLAAKEPCPLVDNDNPFISVLSNNIINLSGWPDLVLDTYSSKEGPRKEKIEMVDSSIHIYSSYDLDCTFINSREEPIALLIDTWCRYMANVYEGIMSPYLDMITENEIDYQTRIYRLVLDENEVNVKKIAATGASFPINLPTGRFYDYTDDRKYNDQNKEITVRFRSIAAMYNDPILIEEFNKTVAIFNPQVANLLSGKQHNLEKVPKALLKIFSNRVYPIINKNTLELEWWVNKSIPLYKTVINIFSKRL